MLKISLKMLCLKYKQCWGASTFLHWLQHLLIKVYRLWLPLYNFLPALAPYTFFLTGSGSLHIYLLQPAHYRFFNQLQLPLKRPGSPELFLEGFTGFNLLFIGLLAPSKNAWFPNTNYNLQNISLIFNLTLSVFYFRIA